jgi:hypothetical protein
VPARNRSRWNAVTAAANPGNSKNPDNSMTNGMVGVRRREASSVASAVMLVASNQAAIGSSGRESRVARSTAAAPVRPAASHRTALASGTGVRT